MITLDLFWMRQYNWAIIATGEGAACSVVAGSDIPRELHDFMCVCGNADLCWDEQIAGILEDMKDSDSWEFDELQRPFRFTWKHECGAVSITRVDDIKTSPLSDGAGLITAERRRQIEKEGWTPEHDDCHADAELTNAACAYAEVAAMQIYGDDEGVDMDVVPDCWPFSIEWWKPSKDTIKNLKKAGAFLAAEIDRIHRTVKP